MLRVSVLTLVLVCVGTLAIFINCFMLVKKCPKDEAHRSCSFYEEHTCWTEKDRRDRLKTPPKRLSRCRAGCFCRRGLVREYPGGPCIVAAACRDRRLQGSVMNEPPMENMFYL